MEDKAIDYWAHMLDEAFVEGGAPTCAAVSNMAPDELYEERADWTDRGK